MSITLESLHEASSQALVELFNAVLLIRNEPVRINLAQRYVKHTLQEWLEDCLNKFDIYLDKNSLEDNCLHHLSLSFANLVTAMRMVGGKLSPEKEKEIRIVEGFLNRAFMTQAIRSRGLRLEEINEKRTVIKAIRKKLTSFPQPSVNLEALEREIKRLSAYIQTLQLENEKLQEAISQPGAENLELISSREETKRLTEESVRLSRELRAAVSTKEEAIRIREEAVMALRTRTSERDRALLEMKTLGEERDRILQEAKTRGEERNQALREVKVLREQLDSALRDTEIQRLAAEQAQNQLTIVQRNLVVAQAAAARVPNLEQRLEALEPQLADSLAREATLEVEKKAREDRILALTHNLTMMTARATQLEARVTQLSGDNKAQQERIAQLEPQLAEGSDRIRQLELERRAQVEVINTLRSQQQAAESRAASAQEAEARAIAERSAAQAEVARAKGEASQYKRFWDLSQGGAY